MNPARGRLESSADDDLDRLERFAELLDAEFRVPGTNFRFGLDPLVGLLPGVGDSAMAMASLWIVYEARRLGASRATLARMLGNVAVDALVGVIPVVGDIFDASYRANRRNVALLRRSLRDSHRRPRHPDAGSP